MNSALDKFAHNVIIDEIVYWPPKEGRVLTIHSNVPSIGNCSVLIKYDDESEIVVEIERGYFEESWNEACAVLKAVTDIKGDFSPLTKDKILLLEADRQICIGYRIEGITNEANREKRRAMEKAIELFEAGMYEVFLEQFGSNYTSLPDSMVKRIEIARGKING